MWWTTDYTAASCDCPTCNGREVRIWNGCKAKDAILASPDATHNAVVGAARLPFSLTVSNGYVLTEKIPAHA